MNRLTSVHRLLRQSIKFLGIRQQSTGKQTAGYQGDEQDSFPPKAHFDWDYLTDPDNIKVIENNIAGRKGVGNPQLVCELHRKWLDSGKTDKEVEKKLMEAAADIPNQTHPMVPMGPKERELAVVGKKPDHNFKLRTIGQLGEHLKILRTENMVYSSGHKSYYFMDGLAALESALVDYTLDVLDKQGFRLISVPNILHPSIVEGCGFKVNNTSEGRTQVYKLDPAAYGDACLAGTGEIPLAGFFMNRILEEKDLPQMVTTVSHCYRSEAKSVNVKKDLYRVHQFTKVEMFGVCSAEAGRSEEAFHKITNIQKQLFEPLGLHFRILDMPRHELGAPAYRKFDMEAWMPAKQFWGEISSASNCTDFQSRRLNIRYRADDGEMRFAHTVNGTGCAVPRLVIALLETHQEKNGSVRIPDVLQPYMPNGQTHITRNKNNKLANLKFISLNKFKKMKK